MQAESKATSATLASFENLAKLTPFLTAAVLAISITYDSAYLWALGLSLADIPSSISEHIRSALLWLPIILFLVMGLFIIFAITEKSDKMAKTEAKSTNFDKYQILLLIIAGLLQIVLNIYLIFYLNEKRFIFVLVSFMWFLVVAKLMIDKKNKKIEHPMLIFLLFVSPVILCLFGFIGYTAGSKVLNQDKPQWEYIIKKDDKEIPLSINGQRRFTEFTIAILPEKKILIIPNSNILSMKTP